MCIWGFNCDSMIDRERIFQRKNAHNCSTEHKFMIVFPNVCLLFCDTLKSIYFFFLKEIRPSSRIGEQQFKNLPNETHLIYLNRSFEGNLFQDLKCMGQVWETFIMYVPICQQQQRSEIMEYTVECFNELFLSCTCTVDGI